MQKRVWRHREIALFSLNIEELRAFCLALLEEFDNSDDVSASIEVKLPGGVCLEFESIEEMMEYPSLPDIIHEYAIRINDSKRIWSRDGGGQSSWYKLPMHPVSKSDHFCILREREVVRRSH